MNYTNHKKIPVKVQDAVFRAGFKCKEIDTPNGTLIYTPTYIDVWLWHCAHGGSITPICIHPNVWQVSTCNGEWDNPEDAIVDAIDYLVDNKLIQ